MSTKGKRDFRPMLHFTPESGWINDPNGLVYENGNYHLFAQYFHEPHWGPMHWCHAVSRDLIHWEHLPIALAPDSLGMIFSGSAVYDTENSSGLGEGRAPIVAMYTSHGDTEQQSIAFSTDLIHFTPYDGNPVIENKTLPDFRDPKLFRHPLGGWGVVMAAGDRVVFYRSENLKEWEKTGEFGPGGNLSKGVWECPDLFPLTLDGKEYWILLVSMGANEENRGSRTQYFIGAFNGKTFTCAQPFDHTEFIDQSFDHYAGVTFDHTPGGEKLMVAWCANWVYANSLPTGDFCGQMTFARRFSLVQTPKGVRLGGSPVTDGIFEKEAASGKEGTLPGEVFRLTVRGNGTGKAVLFNDAGEEFVFGVNQAGEMFIDRRRAGARDFDEHFSSDRYGIISATRFFDGGWEMDLYFDHSVTEIYADQGTRTFTQLVYPNAPYTCFRLEGGAETAVLRV